MKHFREAAAAFVFLVWGTALAGDERPRSGPASEQLFPPLRVPAGFRATLFACDPLVAYPSVIAAGPRAGAVLVAVDYVAGLGPVVERPSEIRLIEDRDGDGYADRAAVVASGFNSIQGLDRRGDTLFVMHAPFLTAVRDRDGDGVAEERRDLLTGLGLPPEQNPSRLHCANGVIVGHDGWLYLALGDNGCDVPRPEGDRLIFHGGGILRCRPDGRDLHLFATGLRNTYDLALDEDLNVFLRDNENDGGDYLIRVNHSFFGADHGYPYLYAEHPDEALPSLAILGRGSSAGGLCYLETGFPAAYRGDLFFCEWGRAVVRCRPERLESGFGPVAEVEFASGGAGDPYGFKPTDLIAQRDGSLIVSDWADGQRPRRGRGRLYRITATDPPPARVPGGDALARLDSDSLTERREAQEELEGRGAAGLDAVRAAIAAGRLGVRGRLHAVWIVARLGGPAAIGELLEWVEHDPEPRVQAQAVRAIADLSDPVFLQHRLESGPGDAALAETLAALALGRDPRVVLEATLALGRLRWAGLAAWMKQALGRPDPTLAHAAMQALRRSGNWAAVLALVDQPDPSPLRAIGLGALAERFEPDVVAGLITRLRGAGSPARRRAYAEALARVYKKPGPWVYWGYRPAPRPANPVAWEQSAAIAAALNAALTDADLASVRLAVLRRMLREKVPTQLSALRGWLRAGAEPDAVAAIVEALRDHPADERHGLLAEVIADRSHRPEHRLAALGLWPLENEGTAARRLLELALGLEDGPVLAAALERLGGQPEAASGASGLIDRALDSPEAVVRAAAVAAVARLGRREAGDRVRERLADREAAVRRAAAGAAGALRLQTAVEPLLGLAGDPDPTVRRASLEALRRLREPKAVPLAIGALADRATQGAALACLAELGGPNQADALADLARRSPTAEILPLAVQTLTGWGRTEAQKRRLDRAVAEVQGTTGLLVRWQVGEPGAGPPGEPFAPSGPDATRFGTGSELRVRLGAPAASAPGTAWTDFLLDQPATVQFLGSSNGTMRVAADGELIHQRWEAQPFLPDSDRFTAELGAGSHRVAVTVAATVAAAMPAEFHLRFRRVSSTAEHERLVQLTLNRPGNPEHGRLVFEDVEKSQCLKCHRLGDRGERIGPELTGIGGRFARITIIESILEPSRALAPSFETLTVALTDGRVLSGVRIAETETTLKLGDQDGTLHELNKPEIASTARASVSTMPDGLEKRLTPDEFVDLIAFLAGQK